MKQNTSKWN